MRWWLPVTLCLSACSQRGDENLGLSPREITVDVARLTEPAELIRAAALSGYELDRRLGARCMSASSKLSQTLDTHESLLQETFSACGDGKGAVHLIHDNSRGNGFEAIAIADELWARPRYGRFVKRRPELGELDRLRATAETPLASYLRLFERFVEIKRGGNTELAGHSVLKLTLGLRKSPQPPSKSSPPGQAWRGSLKVSALEGEVAVDTKSGALLGATLDAQYSFERGDKSAAAELAFQQSTSSDAEAISPPGDWTALGRPRPMLDRQLLLKGLR